MCENIKEAQEELKDIRHDLKNRLNTLSYAIQLKDYSEAEKELGNILDNINIVGKPKYCANLRINSILAVSYTHLDVYKRQVLMRLSHFM